MRTSLIVALSLSVALATPASKAYKKVRPNSLKHQRIINGDEAAAGQFPWQASVSVSDGFSSWFCGGSIISEEWILTAGHCVDAAVSADIRTGTLNPNSGMLSQGTTFILHEAYDPFFLINDIGLIKLTEPLTFDDNTQAIPLSEDVLDVDVNVVVSGWGLQHEDDTTVSENLSFVSLVTVSNEECAESYGSVPESQVCAKSGDATVRSTCNGDSGGPLIINADSSPVHVGVVSYVHIDGCESGHPAGFTRTSAYRDWIKTNAGV